jgi:phosphoribosyl-dephospho-CoA transferase
MTLLIGHRRSGRVPTRKQLLTNQRQGICARTRRAEIHRLGFLLHCLLERLVLIGGLPRVHQYVRL